MKDKYIKTINPLFNRLQGIWIILSKRNFILVYVNKDKVSVKSRTDYTSSKDISIIQIAKELIIEKYLVKPEK